MAAFLWPGAPASADCGLTSTGLVPLTDLGSDLYQGRYQGGLYPDGASIRPRKLRKASKQRMKAVEPLDRFGSPDPDGAIVFISVGVSNTKLEFGNFQDRAERDPGVNPQVVMFNAAQGGTPADEWVDPNAEPWTRAIAVMERHGFSREQVQVAWVKHAHRRVAENGPFPTHAELLQSDLESVARALRTNFPNLHLAYFSSRTRAWTDDPDDQSPEPWAYENGFAVKWMIERQLDGNPDLSHDAQDGPAKAPLLLWGPYIWADGDTPRSDGFVWKCSDTRTREFIHPSDSGMKKVGSQLMAFFKTHPTARDWFLRDVPRSDRPKVSISADRKKGPAPLEVRLGAEVTLIGKASKVLDYNWTFDDGTFSREREPVKLFREPGKYKIWVTVTDDRGNTRSKKKKITVTG